MNHQALASLHVLKQILDLQAQTVANFYLAFEQNLEIVPLLNKCDMQNAEPDRVAEQMQQVLHSLLLQP